MPSGGKPRSPVAPHVARTARTIFAFQDRRGVRNVELAKLSGLSAAQISYMRRGQRNPTLAMAEYMAGALGLEIIVRSRVERTAQRFNKGH